MGSIEAPLNLARLIRDHVTALPVAHVSAKAAVARFDL